MVRSSCGETSKRGAGGQRQSETLVPPTHQKNVPHRCRLKVRISESRPFWKLMYSIGTCRPNVEPFGCEKDASEGTPPSLTKSFERINILLELPAVNVSALRMVQRANQFL